MPITTNAIRIHETGGPEVMRWEPVEVPDPGPGEVRLRHTVVGLNFIDVNHRNGGYPIANLPAVIGMEAAGEIEALGPGVGDGVEGFAAGDRVSYCMIMGAYAERRTIAADRLIKLPDTIADEVAAASTLQGLTAHYLLHESYALRAGDSVLIRIGGAAFQQRHNVG